MRKPQLVISSFFITVSVMANTPALEKDIALAWEQQVRSWIPGVPKEKSPVLLFRLLEEAGRQEDMFAIYEGTSKNLILAWARSREVNAQSIFNMYRYEVGSPVPPIPIELRYVSLDKETFDALVKAEAGFIKTKPKSWDDLAETGHAGSIFAFGDALSHVFDGPIPAKSEPTVSKLFSLITRLQKRMQTAPSCRVYEFPQTEKMTQWRFNRALMNGEEGLAIYLLSIGASPDKDLRFFESPLEQAIIRENKALFEALVKHGANTKAPTSTGLTIEEFAKKSKATWALEILGKFGKV